MKTINTKKAIQLLASWHGGQWSAMYQYMSSGIYMPENALWYIYECLQDIENEFYANYPRILPAYQVRELRSLIRYFEKKAKEHGILIEYVKHPVYGYTVPQVSDNINGHKIDGLRLPS